MLSRHPGASNTGRCEFKYTVSEEVACAIAQWAAPWVRPDKHVPDGQTGYTITSLYLDTPDLAFHWAKRTLQPNRIKLRVRTYGPRGEGPFFAEIKRRFNDVMVKTRALIAPEGVPAIAGTAEEDPDPTLHAATLPGRHVVADFVSNVRGLALRPVVVVRYDREPLAGIYERNTRLTFDRRLRVRHATGLVVQGDDTLYRCVDYAALFDQGQSQVIVELKFDGRPPLWMQDLVYRFGLLRSSFSKYAAGVDVLADEGRVDAPGRLSSVFAGFGVRSWTS